MSYLQKIIAWLTAFLTTALGITGLTTQQRAEALRVVAYVIADNAAMMEAIDESHLDDLTDIILIGSLAGFDTEGRVNLSKDFEQILTIAREKIGERPIRLHLNLLGPWATANGTFDENMYALGEVHRQAFASGVLEGNIRSVLDTYNLDGVFFDYEFPVAQVHKNAFSKFLVSLKKVLGDDYVLGAAQASWCAKLSRAAIRSLDMVEVMSYDVWDEGTGLHSSFEITRAIIRGMRRLGYKREQLDVGIPFYARPTTEEPIWYDYKEYYDKIDENGYAPDEANGVIASFNTPAVVYEKTEWAIKQALGGVMIWHYSCDVPKGNDASLFNAVARAKQDMAARVVC